MVTGVETAGLVLAIFPLAIEGLKFYLKGLESIRRWWRYAAAVRQLLRALTMERVKFEESCEDLLCDLVTSQDLERLLEAPGGAEWQHVDLQSALRSRLGRTFDVFMAAVADMKTALECFKEKLDLDYENGSVKARQPVFKDQWRRIRLSLMAEENNQMLKDMDKRNKDIETLLGRKKRMDPLKAPSSHAGKYQRLRRNTEGLFRAVSKGLTANCSCLATHIASLKLEARFLFKYALETGSGTKICNPSFNIVLSFEIDPSTAREPRWTWRETSFKSVPYQSSYSSAVSSTADKDNAPFPLSIRKVMSNAHNEKPAGKALGDGGANGRSNILSSIRPAKKNRVSFATSTLVHSSIPQLASPLELPTSPIEPPHPSSLIEDGLCEKIASAHDEDSYLGVLASDAEELHHISIKKEERQSEDPKLISLESLLLRNFEINRKRSLILALRLAASVLQLHDTPWLKERWGKQDIKFIAPRKFEDDSLIDRSFVSREIESSEHIYSRAVSKTTALPGVRNSSLFSLGVILIELWFGKTLESLNTWIGSREDTRADTAKDVTVAFQLLDEVYSQAGEWYGDAVRRCLYCDFDRRSPDLKDNALKESVVRGVILPLKEHLKAFCGGQLDDTIWS